MEGSLLVVGLGGVGVLERMLTLPRSYQGEVGEERPP